MAKPINEGAGAGYKVSADCYISNVKDIKLNSIQRYSGGTYGDLYVDALFDCDIELYASDLEFGSYYYGGELDRGVDAVATQIGLSFNIELPDDIDSSEITDRGVRSIIEDIVPKLPQILNKFNFSTETTVGGGYTHTTYQGELADVSNVTDIKSSDNYGADYGTEIDSITAKITEQKVIDYMDNVVTGNNIETSYVVYDADYDMLDSFSEKEDAVEYAEKTEDAQYVIEEIYEVYIDGEWHETSDSGSIVWDKDDEEEDMQESLHDSPYDGDEIATFIKMAKEIGLKTLDDLGYFLKREHNQGEPYFDTVLRYRASLGNDYKLKEGLTEDAHKDYNELFSDLLDLTEFSLEKVSDHTEDDGKFVLIDNQGANIGGIQTYTFDTASEILDRLDMYIEDYYLDAIKEIAEDGGIEIPEDVVTVEDYVDWYNSHKGEPEFDKVFGDSADDFAVLDMIANHADEVDLESVYNKYYKESLVEKTSDNNTKTFTIKGIHYTVTKIEDSMDKNGYIAKWKDDSDNGLGYNNQGFVNFDKTNYELHNDDNKPINDFLYVISSYDRSPANHIKNKIKEATLSLFNHFDKEPVTEDTKKLSNGKWANVGKDGKVDSGTFKTKKEADAQRRAIYARGYKG